MNHKRTDKTEGASIILPVYNEEGSIVVVIESVLKAMRKRGIPIQAVVVDDGSTDRTKQLVISEFGENSDVLLVSHRVNRGVGIARNTGIDNSSFEIVGMIDADGTYPAESIPDLVEKMAEYDMVVGARRQERGKTPFLRKLAKDSIRLLASYLFDTRIPDLNSGLRLFKKQLVLRYRYLLPPGHSWVSTITLAFLANGHSVCFYPVDYFPRQKGKSSFHPLLDTYNYFLLVLRACTYFNPMKFFTPLFALLFLLGSVKTAIDIFVFHGIQESDIILLIAALLILVLGLLCDLIVTQGKKIP
jgi:glycosyltransferase involved in cell wall biosynthesis